nr:Chain P, decamer fragment of Phospholipid scramblase 1
GKISKHWTGI